MSTSTSLQPRTHVALLDPRAAEQHSTPPSQPRRGQISPPPVSLASRGKKNVFPTTKKRAPGGVKRGPPLCQATLIPMPAGYAGAAPYRARVGDQDYCV